MSPLPQSIQVGNAELASKLVWMDQGSISATHSIIPVHSTISLVSLDKGLPRWSCNQGSFILPPVI